MKAEYIDHMGDDLRVVNAARVSFDKESKELGDKDERLLKYLASHNHWTPFAHCTITMRETIPIFIARQRFKHTVGFVYNEVSRRYVDDEPEFYYPDVWRSRPEGSIKQGSGEKPVRGTLACVLESEYEELIRFAESLYKKMIIEGVAPEQARMVLPQSMYTSYYVTGSLAAWARAYKLRHEKSAQLEIQELAKQWNKIIQPLFPISWKYLIM